MIIMGQRVNPQNETSSIYTYLWDSDSWRADARNADLRDACIGDTCLATTSPKHAGLTAASTTTA